MQEPINESFDRIDEEMINIPSSLLLEMEELILNTTECPESLLIEIQRCKMDADTEKFKSEIDYVQTIDLNDEFRRRIITNGWSDIEQRDRSIQLASYIKLIESYRGILSYHNQNNMKATLKSTFSMFVDVYNLPKSMHSDYKQMWKMLKKLTPSGLADLCMLLIRQVEF